MKISSKGWLTPVVLGGALLAGCERPPVETVQTGYRGTGMVQVYNPRTVASEAQLNAAPEAPPQAPPVGPKAKDIYQNVQVLGDLSVTQFVRLMAGITEWVSPEQGCTYCHEGENFAEDTLYTKVVSRRMLQMTQTINEQWGAHVGATGVTCYTCHRGANVPSGIWFNDPGPKQAGGMAASRAGQNMAAAAVGQTSMHHDPFSPLLMDAQAIRAVGTTALPTGNTVSLQDTERTYGLMIHMSSALGVNCTYCHNTRSMGEWAESSPQRVTAWHGIRMVRQLNQNYLEPLGPQYPASRIGPTGDAPKVNCETCHKGAFKPLYGAQVLADYPSLGGPGS